ncbi:hypothetical protein B0H13DRAFT_2305943 [Mycena leptocephala]|nr:hypothetical protein B0H13DRAFT_2305943 [Mycena leptocephala]
MSELVTDPPYFVVRKVSLYPWSETPRLHPDFLLLPDRPTLRDNNQLFGWFFPNPVQCTRCLKPNVRHPAIPGATFTILVSCQHGTEDDVAENRFPNRSVAAILPYTQLQFTCLGNLVVVKHSLPAPNAPSASNADLPIVDLEPADFPFVDKMVARWCYHIHMLAQKEQL